MILELESGMISTPACAEVQYIKICADVTSIQSAQVSSEIHLAVSFGRGFAVTPRLSKGFRLEGLEIHGEEGEGGGEDSGLAKTWKYLHSSENDVGQKCNECLTGSRLSRRWSAARRGTSGEANIVRYSFRKFQVEQNIETRAVCNSPVIHP